MIYQFNYHNCDQNSPNYHTSTWGQHGLPKLESHKLQHLIQTPDGLHHQTLLYYPETYKTYI